MADTKKVVDKLNTILTLADKIAALCHGENVWDILMALSMVNARMMIAAGEDQLEDVRKIVTEGTEAAYRDLVLIDSMGETPNEQSQQYH